MDSSMIIGYGHDDRVCAYPSLIAQINVTSPKKTSVCILVDKEEIGRCQGQPVCILNSLKTWLQRLWTEQEIIPSLS